MTEPFKDLPEDAKVLTAITPTKGWKPQAAFNDLPAGATVEPFPHDAIVAHQAKVSEDMGWALVGGRPTGVDPEHAGMVGATLGGIAAAPVAAGTAATVVGAPVAPLIEVGGIGLGYSMAKQAAHLWNKYAVGNDTTSPGANAMNAVKDVAGGSAGAMAGMGAGKVLEGVGERIATDPMARQAYEATIPAKAQQFASSIYKGWVRAFGDEQGAGGEERARQFLGLIGQQAAKETQTDASAIRLSGSPGAEGQVPAGTPAPTASNEALGAHPAQPFGASPGEALALRTTAPGAAEKVAAGDMGRPGLLEDLQKAGVDPAGATQMLTKDPVILGLFDAQKKNPQTARILAKPMQRAMDQLETGWDKALSRVGDSNPADRELVGDQLKARFGEQKAFVEKGKGLEEGVESLGGLKAQPKLEADYVQARGGPDKQIYMGKAQNELLQMKDEATRPGGGIDSDKFPPRLQNLLKDIQDGKGKLPLGYARETRTMLGEESGLHQMEPTSSKFYSRIYGPMTDDFAADAKASGGDAEQAWNRAQTNYQTWAERRGFLKQVHDSPNGLAAFDEMTRGNAQALNRWRAAHETLSPEEKGDLVAQYMGDLSKDPKTGRLDLNRWVTKWSGLKEPIKAEITRDNPELGEVADRYFRIGQAARESGWLNNFSNTAAGILYHDVVNQGGLEAAQAVGDAVRQASQGKLSRLAGGAVEAAKAPFALTDTMKAQLLTDPKFIDMMNQAEKIKPTDTTGIALHLDRLGAMIGAGKFNPESRDGLTAWLGALKQRADLLAAGKGAQSRPAANGK